MTGSLIADFIIVVVICVVGLMVLIGWVQFDVQDFLASIGNFFINLSGK